MISIDYLEGQKNIVQWLRSEVLDSARDLNDVLKMLDLMEGIIDKRTKAEMDKMGKALEKDMTKPSKTTDE